MTSPMPPMPPQGYSPQPPGYYGPPPPEKKRHGLLYVLLGIVIGIAVIVVAISICFAVVVKKGVDKAEEVGLINTETHTGSIGSSLEVGNNLEMTVYGAEKYVDPSGQVVGDTPKDGYYFLVLDVGFVNNGKETESVSSLMEMTVKDSAGREYDPTYLIHKTPSLPEGDIAVGEKARGYVAFEIPVGTTSGLTFKFAPLLGDTGLVSLGTIK